MKHTRTVSKTVKKRKKCQHELTPRAAFVDDESKEAWLLQVCELCGEVFLLIGQYPLTIYG